MTEPILYRRRIIPDECVLLKNDHILMCSEDLIVTSWDAIRPKPDLRSGYSCYYLKRGYKISQFCGDGGNHLYWYCDIVDYGAGIVDGRLTVTDLLADVIIKPDGSIRVVDLDELADAFDRGLIDAGMLKNSLNSLNSLLEKLYAGRLDELIKPITDLKNSQDQ